MAPPPAWTWPVLLAATALGGLVSAVLAARLAGRRMEGGLAAAGMAVALAMAASVWASGTGQPLWASLLLGWTLMTLAGVDVLAFRLPDALTLPFIAAGLGEGVLQADLLSRAIGCVLGFATLAFLASAYRRVRGRAGLGLGDAKLYAVAGAWLGWAALPAVLLIACGLGLLWAAALVLRRGRSAVNAPLPFGAPLACAIWAVWLLQ